MVIWLQQDELLLMQKVGHLTDDLQLLEMPTTQNCFDSKIPQLLNYAQKRPCFFCVHRSAR